MTAASPDRRVALVVTAGRRPRASSCSPSLLVPWDPVPGGTPDPVPASLGLHRRADRPGRGLRPLGADLELELARRLAGGRVRARLQPLGRRGWSAGCRAGGGCGWCSRSCVVVLIGRVITLPFAVLLRRHVLDNGLSNQGWSGFAADVVRTEAVSIVATSVLLVVLVGCARRWPRAWPAVAGGLLGALVLLGSFVYPVLVEPIFNDFEPLPDGPLRTEVLELAEREGVPVDDVLVADASRRTTTLNAYVSGFGGTRRVVLYDNLVDDVPRDEALSVVAHELAHAKHDDVLDRVAARRRRRGRSGSACWRWWSARWRRAVGRRCASPAVVPLVLALLALGTPARRAGAERDQPADRDPRRRRRARGHPRPAGLRGRAAPAGAAVARRPDPAAALAALVRLAPDRADPDRDRPAARRPAGRISRGRARRPRP